MRITVAEDKHRQFSGAVGYGTEEKARIRGEWKHVNFFGGARTAGVESKWSSLDRGVRLNFSEPWFFTRHLAFSAQAQAWDEREPVYRVTTYGGRAGVSWRRERRNPVTRRGATTSVEHVVHQRVHRLRVSDEALADPALRNALISLGLDPETGAASGTLVSLRMQADHDTTSSRLDPQRGFAVSGALEQAGKFLPGDLHLHRVQRRGARLHLDAPAVRRGPPRHRLRRPPARRDHRRAAAGRHLGAVLQALLPRRLDQRPRLGPLRAEPADRDRPADRRPHRRRNVRRGARAVRHQAERGRLRRRRQRRPQSRGSSIPAASASPSVPASATTRPIGPVRFDRRLSAQPDSRAAREGRAGDAVPGAPTSASARPSDMAIRFRRWLRIGSFVLALFVGLLVVAIVTTQTAWFRDWLRRYVIREADGYLNGDAGDPAARRQPVHRDRDRRRVADAGPPHHLRGQGRRPELQRVGSDLRRRRHRRDPHQRAAPRLEPRAVGLERRRPRQGAGAGGRSRRARPSRSPSAASASRTAPSRSTIPRGRSTSGCRSASIASISRARSPISRSTSSSSSATLSFRASEPALALNSLSGRVVVNQDDVTVERLAIRTAESALSARGAVRVVPRHADARSRAVVGEADAARVRRLRAGARRRAPAAGLRGDRAGPPRRAGHRAVDAQRRRHAQREGGRRRDGAGARRCAARRRSASSI